MKKLLLIAVAASAVFVGAPAVSANDIGAGTFISGGADGTTVVEQTATQKKKKKPNSDSGSGSGKGSG
jgi:hypothetical protein